MFLEWRRGMPCLYESIINPAVSCGIFLLNVPPVPLLYFVFFVYFCSVKRIFVFNLIITVK